MTFPRDCAGPSPRTLDAIGSDACQVASTDAPKVWLQGRCGICDQQGLQKQRGCDSTTTCSALQMLMTHLSSSDNGSLKARSLRTAGDPGFKSNATIRAANVQRGSQDSAAAHRSLVTFAAGQDSGPLRPPHLSAVT